MSLQEAFRLSADGSTFTLFAPTWVKNLPIPRIRAIRDANDAVTAFIKESIAERRGGGTESTGANAKDVFSVLLRANEEEGGKLKLDEGELVGNVWIMMFAGHGAFFAFFFCCFGGQS